MVEIFKVLAAASKLDIVDLNYEFSSENLGTIDKPIEGLKPKSLVVNLAHSFFYTARSAVKRVVSKKNKEPVSDILFFCQGEKHLWALRSVAEHVPNSFIVDNTQGLSEHFSHFTMRLLSLIFLPFLVRTYLRSRGYQRRSILYVFDNYLLTYGNYIVFRRFFQRHDVTTLVVANDHSYKCTTIAQAARDEGVKTFYIQHASVTDKFPALKFDYALLEGMDAVVKYDRCGPSRTKVFMVGMPKQDAFVAAINRNKKLVNLGICPNTLDPFDKVRDIVEHLRSDFPGLAIFLRPHPSDTSRPWSKLCSEYAVEYCAPRAEISFVFLSRVDAIVVGNSSIALEAALLNVYPICYDFSGLNFDHYDFIRDGLIEKHTNQYDDVKQWVADLADMKPNIRGTTKRYCDTVGTIYDGRSSLLAAQLVTSADAEETSDSDLWQKVESTKNLEVYGLRERSGI